MSSGRSRRSRRHYLRQPRPGAAPLHGDVIWRAGHGLVNSLTTRNDGDPHPAPRVDNPTPLPGWLAGDRDVAQRPAANAARGSGGGAAGLPAPAPSPREHSAQPRGPRRGGGNRFSLEERKGALREGRRGGGGGDNELRHTDAGRSTNSSLTCSRNLLRHLLALRRVLSSLSSASSSISPVTKAYRKESNQSELLTMHHDLAYSDMTGRTSSRTAAGRPTGMNERNCMKQSINEEEAVRGGVGSPLRRRRGPWSRNLRPRCCTPSGPS